MTWDGFLPAHNCKRCGKPLSRDNAELYAGSYTGLCYQCERKPVIIIEVSQLDGAIHKEYPPHCPSWRRDREVYTAYGDCQDCKGSGRIYVSRGYPQGGPYYTQCKTCWNRYYNNPRRESYHHWLEQRSEIYHRWESIGSEALAKLIPAEYVTIKGKGKKRTVRFNIPKDSPEQKTWQEQSAIYYAKLQAEYELFDQYTDAVFPDIRDQWVKQPIES